MTILDCGKKQVALILAGSVTTNYYPTYFMTGSGSGANITTLTALVAPVDRQLLTSVDASTPYKIKFTGDWSTVEMSGTNLREFGVCVSGITTTGSMWSRIGIPNVIFNGTNELRIEENWEVF